MDLVTALETIGCIKGNAANSVVLKLGVYLQYQAVHLGRGTLQDIVHTGNSSAVVHLHVHDGTGHGDDVPSEGESGTLIEDFLLFEDTLGRWVFLLVFEKGGVVVLYLLRPFLVGQPIAPPVLVVGDRIGLLSRRRLEGDVLTRDSARGGITLGLVELEEFFPPCLGTSKTSKARRKGYEHTVY